jgi:hypothetical protein
MPNSSLLVGLGGSLREKSYSRAALREALRIAETKAGAATELLDVRELNLPMFVPDLPIEGYPSAQQPRSRSSSKHPPRGRDDLVLADVSWHGQRRGEERAGLHRAPC